MNSTDIQEIQRGLEIVEREMGKIFMKILLNQDYMRHMKTVSTELHILFDFTKCIIKEEEERRRKQQ